MRIHPFHDGDSFASFRNRREQTVREIEALENDYGQICTMLFDVPKA
jgi:hypothetical protein